MKKLVVLLFLTGLIASNSYAFFSTKSVGTTGLPFLKIAVDARYVGMGDVGSAVVSDASAMYWNPAGLAGIGNMNVTATYNRWFVDTNQGFIAAAKRMGFGVLGIAVNYLTVGNIEERTTTGANVGTYKNSNMAVNLAYAKTMGNLQAGATLKYATQKMTSNLNEVGYGLDAGIVYNGLMSGNAKAAFVLQNLGPKTSGDGGGSAMPLNIKLGYSMAMLKGNKLLLASDINIPSDNQANLHVGVEYMVIPMLALRAGFRTDRESLGSLTGLALGFGFNMQNVSFDLAYSPYTNLGSTAGGVMRASVAASF